MPITTPEERANRSANRRLNEWVAKLANARVADKRSDRHDDKHQWGTLVGWLLSESKHLSAEDRQKMFAHLLADVKTMNQASRVVPDSTYAGSSR